MGPSLISRRALVLAPLFLLPQEVEARRGGRRRRRWRNVQYSPLGAAIAALMIVVIGVAHYLLNDGGSARRGSPRGSSRSTQQRSEIISLPEQPKRLGLWRRFAFAFGMAFLSTAIAAIFILKPEPLYSAIRDNIAAFDLSYLRDKVSAFGLVPGCNVKGKVSINTGERIYHVPGQKYYGQTTIDPLGGERWFCSEAEARRAGWRRSRI